MASKEGIDKIEETLQILRNPEVRGPDQVQTSHPLEPRPSQLDLVQCGHGADVNATASADEPADASPDVPKVGINEMCRKVSTFKLSDVEYMVHPFKKRFGTKIDIGPFISFINEIASLSFFSDFRDKCENWEEICDSILSSGSTQQISNVICFHGPAGSGKSCASEIVKEYLPKKKFKSIGVFPFAAIPKKILEAILKPVFPTIAYEDKLNGSQEEKEQPINELKGKKMRECIIMFSNAVFKTIFSDKIWFQAWRKSITKRNVIVDDVRFPVEVEGLEDLAKHPKIKVLLIALHNGNRKVYANTNSNESEKRMPDEELREKFGSHFLSIHHNGKDLTRSRSHLPHFLKVIFE